MLHEVQGRITRLLNWSEKYTKTDMRYVTSGALLSLFGQGTGLIASLLLAVAVNHWVPKEVYGNYKFVLSIVAILSLFSLTGIGSAVFQAASQGLDGALRKGFWENIKWSVGVFVGGLLVAGYYFLNGNAALATCVLIGASFSPFLASASLFGPFLGGKKDFWHQTAYGIADTVFPILIFIAVILFTSDPIILVATYFITNTLAALFFYGRTLEKYHADLHKHDADLLRYSKHLSAMGIIMGIANNLDQILLFHYVGATQLAVYNFAIAIPEQLKGPVKNLNSMLQARFSMRDDAEIQRDFHNKMLWFGLAGLSVMIIYILAIPYIFKFLFPAYMEAVPYSQIYILWMVAVCFEPTYLYLSAKRKTAELYASNVVYAVLQVGSLFVGVIFWGLLGVVLARVSTRVIASIVNYFLYRRAIRRATT